MPELQERKFFEIRLRLFCFKDRSFSHITRPEACGGQPKVSEPPQFAQFRRQQRFGSVDGTFYELQRPRTEGKLDASHGTKKVCDKRKVRAFYITEKESFSSIFDDPAMDLSYFKKGVDLGSDFYYLVLAA